MAVLSPAELKQISDELFQWYMDMRDYLIAELTADGYPYGSLPLSDEDLLEQHFAMTAEELAKMRMDMSIKWGGKKGEAMWQDYLSDINHAAERVAKRAQEAASG